jgi:phosphotriesterase-related protein
MEVMTVLGPLPSDEMGVTDAHDHLFLSSPALPGEEIDDLATVIEEMRDGARSGLATIVELTPIGLGRRPEALRRASQVARVNVIGATGYHRDVHYRDGHWVHEAPDDLLLERMRADLLVGMHPSDWSDPDLPPDQARAGVIKVGASLGRISDGEHRRLVCAAQASIDAGCAIVIHSEAATCGPEIAQLLQDRGVAPDRVILAHLDRDPDPGLHLELLARGLFLVYDTIGRTKYHPDSVRLELIEAICAAGRGGQILLGLDLGRASNLHAAGGRGLRYLMTDFVPRLRERIGSDLTRRMLVDNPAGAFAIRTAVTA